VVFLAAVYHAVNGGFSFYIAGAGFESLVQDALVQGAPVPAPESWLWPALGMVNVAFALGYITILRWQQWGFFALCILAVVQSALCYAADAGALPTLAVLGAGVVWLAILFGLLRIGGPRSVWAQME